MVVSIISGVRARKRMVESIISGVRAPKLTVESITDGVRAPKPTVESIISRARLPEWMVQGKGGAGTWWAHAAARALRRGVLLAVLAAACVSPTPQASGFFYVHPSPERCSCLLVLPFVNLSNVVGAGELAAELLAAKLNAGGRLHAYGRSSLTKLFHGLGIAEIPILDADFGLMLAKILGADGVIVGMVGGVWGSGSADKDLLVLDARLVSAVDGENLWAASELIRHRGNPAATSAATALRYTLEAMANRLSSELRPQRAVAREACLNPQVRAALRGPPAPQPGREASSPKSPADSERSDLLPSSDVPLGGPTPGPDMGEERMSDEARQLLERLQTSKSVRLEGVTFAGRSTKLVIQSEALLHTLGELMRGTQNLRLQVEVHTDAGRNTEADFRLTQKQATVVAKRLRKRWELPEGRLEPVGRGSGSPIQPNISRRSRETNRRVEIVLIPSETPGALGALGSILNEARKTGKPKSKRLVVISSPPKHLQTTKAVIQVVGQARPGVEVWVNGEMMDVDASGRFEQPITLLRGINTIVVQAKSSEGELSFDTRYVVYKQ